MNKENGRTCIACGKPLKGMQRYFCSVQCKTRTYKQREKARKKKEAQSRPKLTCIVCGKELKGKQRKYCSVCCQKEYEKIQRALYRDNKAVEEERLCIECGRPLKGNQRKYCSTACMDRYRYRQKKKNKGVAPSVYAKCKVCGKEFEVTSHNRVYCSDVCRYAGYGHSEKERNKRWEIKRKNLSAPDCSIEEICQYGKQHNMSYGQVVAMQRLKEAKKCQKKKRS